MVFESIVVDVLNRILGDYIENLDSKQLSIGIWGGDVVLQDLVLKQSALDDLNLPIQNVYGRLGKLVLKIPWKNLYGAPVEAAIDRLYLLVVPNVEVKYDAEKEEKSRQQAKQSDLKRIEEAKKKAATQGKPKADDSFAEKLTTQIIKNVQVKITNIHIRYEDKVTNPGNPFAFGVSLSNLSVETSNEDWKVGVITDAISKIYKVLDLDSLAVYWNCNCPMYSTLSVNDIIKYFSEGIVTRSKKPANYNYLLGPINSSARLRMNPKPENDKDPFSISKILLNFEMEKLAISISKTQYQNLMLLADSMGRMSCGMPYRKYRPFVKTYKGYYREWWKFAYTCILEENVRRRRKNWDWLHIGNHRVLCREYAAAYQFKLQNSKVPTNIQQTLNDCEKQLDVMNLVLIRQRIELEVARLSKTIERNKAKGSWFSGWWGKPASEDDRDVDSSTDILRQFEAAMTPEEKSKLYQAIDYQENSAPAEYPESFVSTNCAFVLRCLEIEILDDTLPTPRILSTELKNVKCRLLQRPAANALTVAVKIDQFTVFGFQQQSIFPQLVTSENLAEGGELLDVLFETNPLDKRCGQRVHVKFLPIKIVYDAQTIIKIVEVFKPPKSLTLDKLQAAAGNKLANFKELSATGIQYAVEKRVVMDVNIDISAPYVMVPYGGLFTSDLKSLLVVNLGHVKIKSVVRNKDSINVKKMFEEGTEEETILKHMRAESYDKYVMELTEVQLLIANKNEDWRTCIVNNIISPMHIVQPVTLTVNLETCLIYDDPRLPKTKITAQLPSIMINMSDDRILSAVDLMQSIPLPGNKNIEPVPLQNARTRSSSVLSIFVNDNLSKKNTLIRKTADVPEDFVQSIDMEVKFEMRELIVTISNKSSKETEAEFEKLLQFRCIALELDMVQRTFNMDVTVRLGGIGLTHFRSLCPLQMISTPMTTGSDEYLFTVEYGMVNPKSPEFHSKYGSCEQRLLLNFTTLELLLHQEAIQELMKVVNDLQSRLEAACKPKHKDRIANAGHPRAIKQISIIEEISQKRGKQVPRRRQKKLIVETIIFKLVANLEQLNITIANDKRHLAIFGIKGAATDLIIKKSYTQLNATLKDLNIYDCNPYSLHSKIVCKTSNTEDTINAQIVLYNNTEIEKTNDDIKLFLSVTGLKITFLNLFVSSILDFLNQFQIAQQAIIDASAAAAETAKLNMQNIQETATRIDINIKLKAPVIIIPTNSTSHDVIIVDLGNLDLTNNFVQLEVLNEFGHSAVVDDLRLNLLDMKVSRALLDNNLEDKKCECVLLKPLSFILRIKRNLSLSWYNNIPDVDIHGEIKSIELSVSETDYAKMMQVLSENLAEGAHPAAGPVEPATKSLSISKEAAPKKRHVSRVSEQKKAHASLRFSLTMDNLIINLFRRDEDEGEDSHLMAHLPKNGLARFTLLILSVKGSILTDGSISSALLLVDCLLDDTRPEQQSKLTRLMERRTDLDNKTSKLDHVTKSMIDVTFQQKEDNIFADVRVLSFNLILSMDYLMKIGAFFSLPDPKDIDVASAKGLKALKVKTTKSSSADLLVTQQSPSKNMTINLKIEQPSIFLVERMDDINTNTLILNTEILLNARIVGSQQSIRGSVRDLQLYTCCYNPARRKDTKYSVLRPCNINVVGTTPLNKGLHLDVTISEIRLSVSPAVIELLSRCQATMTGAAAIALNESNAIIYYNDIWEQKKFVDSDYWFLRTEQGEDAMDTLNNANFPKENAKFNLKELCVVTANSIIFTMEAGVGNKTLPMLLLETGFEAKIRDWSAKLTIESSLSLQMAYYNSRLAVWEPLVEPCSVMENNVVTYNPWSLSINLKKNDREENPPMSPTSDTETFEELLFTPPLICIDIFSNTNLEIVVTKTFLDVISNLGKAFQKAMVSGMPIQEGKTAPYKVVNDSGLKITLNLDTSVFEVYGQENSTEEYRKVVLESGADVQLDLNSFDVDTRKSRTLIQTNNSIIQNEEKFLNIVVNDMNCSLTLPVLRADKRYFPLNFRGENKDSWGLISDITVDGGVTTITLRSILQVHNYFHQPVNVYFMTDRGNELESIKQIPPDTTLNLPMNAVYTMTNELFFSVDGHCVTAVPYIWKDLQNNLSLEKTLICPPAIKSQQPFVMKVCGDIEQVYYENTSKHTMLSSCYNIHLMPAIIFKNCLPIPVICITQGTMEEFIVKPGEQLHLPTVNPGFSYVVLRLEKYLDREWVCRRDLALHSPEFSVWAFDSHEGIRKITLDLGMHCQSRKGTMCMSLYCPFWMLNKTGLMLTYRNSDDNANILYHPENFKGPILFSFSAKNFFGKKKAAIRVKNGEWSDKFSLDVAGSSGMIVCSSEGVIHQIGVHNQLTYNGLTKQVTFTPFFVLINTTNYSIECQELERPADHWIVVEPNSCKPLWPRSERDDKLLKIKISGTTDVSAPFLFSEVHNTLLKLPNKYAGVNVDIQVTEGGIYLNFSSYGHGLAPALILNHSSQELRIWEKESVNVKRLAKKHQLLHAWENPTGPRLLIWETGKKKELCDELRKDGLGEFSLVEGKRIYWVSFLDGMQRVLLFTEDVCIAKDAESVGGLENIDNEINVAIHGVGISLVNNLIRQELLYIGIASSGIIWETCKSNSKRYKQLSLKECTLIESVYKDYLLNPLSNNTIIVDPKTEVDFKNELMLRPHKRRLRRAFQTGVWVQMKTSPNQMQLHAKINRLQIDNQMHDCIFPIILAPVPPPKSVAADSAIKPFAELSIVQRIMKHSTVQQYKYFKVLIQEFHIKVDLGFINSLMSILQEKEPSQADEIELFTKDMSLVDEPLMSHVSFQSLQEQKNFYDLLHYSPLKIHVSFSLAAPTSGSGNALSGSTPAFLNVLLQGLGVTLTDMNDVVFRLAYFEREYSFLTQRQLISECKSHYVGQFVKQLYVLVLGLDVLGNPYGLVLGISKGVEDLFYEPFQGAIQGPGEFAEGLVLGVRSLFGHTVGGAAGAVSRITGAMGKGIAALTFDKDYQRKRRDQINKKPANIQEGIARGGKGLVMGVVDGVTGVFTKPVQGAKEQGVEGFFKGLGKGAVGLVTRPTAGVIDFASGSLDAVKRATELSDDVNRLRPPRFMRADGLVRPYIKLEAEGNKVLTELEKGKYANTDIYNYHLWIVEKKDILLLTDKRLAYVVHNDIFGGWQMEWSYTWKEIHECKVVDKGIQVTTEQPKKKVLGLFGSGETGKIIIIPDPSQREVIRERMVTLRQHSISL